MGGQQYSGSGLVEKARLYGCGAHRATYHRYGDEPYEVHLQMVFAVAVRYQHLLPPELRETAMAACWVHDCIEDARQTYNDVAKATSAEVADIAYALTNEKGKTRAERANDKYYQGIRELGDVAIFVKLCDRIANVRNCIGTGSSMLQKYANEHSHFWCELHGWRNTILEPMWRELAELLPNEEDE